MLLLLCTLLLSLGSLDARPDGTIACDPVAQPAVVTTAGTVVNQLGYDGTTPYAPSMSCTWRFEAPAGQNVILDFTDFVTEECTDCGCDSVMLYDGVDDTAPLVGTYCGGLTGFSVAGGATMFMRFVSDTSTQGTGFQATYSFGNAACEGGVVLKNMNGTIQSPNFPSNYDNNLACSWTIEVPDNSYYVNVAFTDCDLETSCDATTGSIWDYLDMEEVATGNRLARWFGECPNDVNWIFQNEVGGGGITLSFTSDTIITANGFSLNYNVVQRA